MATSGANPEFRLISNEIVKNEPNAVVSKLHKCTKNMVMHRLYIGTDNLL